MLTKESILGKASSYEILNYYLQPYHKASRLIQGVNISNPFLPTKQQTPSFNIFCALPDHEWRYKDFATGDEGSCFDLVMKLHNLDFVDALHRIDSDLNLCLNGKYIPQAKTCTHITPVQEVKPFSVSHRGFTAPELAYWQRFGITQETLQRFNVSALSQFTAQNKEGKSYTVCSSADKFIFCYNNGSWVKLYKPLDEKQHRFQYLGKKDPGYTFGLDQLPEFGDLVFITGGEKDVLSLSSHGFNAFTLNSETAVFDDILADKIKKRFKKFIVLYDNDETGLKQSELISTKHNIPRITLPAMPNGKDISDFFSIGKTVDELKHLIQAALRPPLKSGEEKILYDGLELVQFGQQAPQYLIAPVFPRKGTAVLAGKPDTGKSQFARQLCIHIALGLKQFIGFNLDIVHQRSVYVSTEDGMEATSYLYQRQLEGLSRKANENIRFMIADTLEQEEILNHLDTQLSAMPADLVVVDSFGDIFRGNDSNNNMAMRNTAKTFDRIAKKHNCLILFVHHINKGAYRQSPGQEHIQGGAGLVQKVRLAIQLTQGEGPKKYFTVVKGNYCPREYKENAIELEFSEDTFLFNPTGKLLPIDELGDQPHKYQENLKCDELQCQAEEIFEDKVLSYTAFVKNFCKMTDQSEATAKRKHRFLAKKGIIVECNGGYRLSDLPSNNEDA